MKSNNIEDMSYNFSVYLDGHGSVELIVGLGSVGRLAGLFKNREEMLEIIDELCTSYPKVIITFSIKE